jgi:SAM-dependent methyltransferase
MDYSLHQRGRATIDFLIALRRLSDRLETAADQYADQSGLRHDGLPRDPAALQEEITPAMQECIDFRMLRLMRDWQLDRHGHIAMDAFEEMREDIAPTLDDLQNGLTDIEYASTPVAPPYWDGYEFHRSAGGWDGHDYMGFVHGELIHRHMIGETYAGAIYELRKQVAGMAALQRPGKILEMGCASGQFTQALAETFPDCEIWACDLSPRQLEQAQRRANEHGADWKLFQAAAEATGIESKSFDLVASYAVFHELPRAVAHDVLRETHRLLKPGGRLLMGDVKAYHVQDPW